MGNCSRGWKSLLLLCVLSAVVTGSSSEEDDFGLEIMPHGSNQTKALGDAVLLTCTIDVPDRNLLTQFYWRSASPQRTPVVNVNDNVKRPPVYSEMLPGGKLALIISTLREEDEGTYSCVAVYSNKEHEKFVHIQTIEKITWVNAPPTQNPIIYSDYTVHCEVRARPSPTVNWFYNGDFLNVTTQRYSELPKGLLIKNISEADDGTYTCRAIVTDTGEMAEKAMLVEVHIPPVMNENMQTNVTVIEGKDANLECHATGKPPPEYKWIKESTQLDLETVGGRFSVEKNKGILTITRVEKDDHGMYRCIASNQAGERAKEVHVNVVVPPKIDPVKNLSTPMDTNIKLECIARGRPLPQVTFRKHSVQNPFVIGTNDGNHITVENKYDKDLDAVVGLLYVDKVLRSDDGLYECIAENTGGIDRKNGHLMVEFKPSFASTPVTEAWSWEDHNINITCLAESIPNATITWRKGSLNITNDRRFTQYDNGPESTLLIKPTDEFFYGDYTCTAVNKHGTTSHVIRVRRAKVPTSLLQARFDATTATTIRFSFSGPSDDGGLPIKAYAVQYREERQTWDEAKNKTWIVDMPYIVEALEPQKRYFFRFAAQNDVGLGPWDVPLDMVMPKRSAPEEPKLLNPVHDDVSVSPYATHYELRWQIPADNGEKIETYQIKVCAVRKVDSEWEERENTCFMRELPADSQPTSYELQKLTSNTHYKVELRAKNSIGFSKPGEIIMRTVSDLTSDNGSPTQRAEDPVLSSAAIVIIVVASLFVLLIIIDLLCFCFNKSGIIMAICEKTRGKPDDSDIKLGSLYSWRFPLPYCSIKDVSHTSAVFVAEKLPEKVPIDEKEPLKDESRLIPPVIQKSVKRETSVDFDMKKSISRTSFVGKDSAV